MRAGLIVLRLVGVVLIPVFLLGACAAWNMQHVPALPAQPAVSVAAATLLTQPIADEIANAAQIRRGQYLVRTGDCLSCHLAPGGDAFAGGLGLNTPFGVIYSSNITSDKNNGIGDWTPEQFYRAMHEGIGDRGKHLYPAFPYPWFTHISREDDDAILAYLKTTPPIDKAPPANLLPFPFNIRTIVAGWNLLFLKTTPFAPDPSQSAEWNRGAAIVNGLGHCGACHTPKNMLGADKSREQFHGGVLENFVAPDLTGNTRTGLGSWSIDDITEYLRSGRNARASAGGPMAEVVTFSTSLMSDEDLRAIATYLKTQTASATETPANADSVSIKRGAEIYSDACSSCHLGDGAGQPRLFPPLGNNAVVQQSNPAGLLHIVLAGSRAGPTTSRPSPLTMPSFAWKLSDQEVADVTTYLRNSWGNQASSVSVDMARKSRAQLGLQTVRLTDNSGDHSD
jgi:mono/diheme cytochrome c family protein